MRYGVDEEHVLFVVMLQIQRVPGHSRLLLMDDGLPLDETMRLLVEWVADGSAPLPMADKALEPVFPPGMRTCRTSTPRPWDVSSTA